MSLEDPFFVVREEVHKAVKTAEGLYARWCELREDSTIINKEEYDWTTNELRNSLKSIEWDLEDLEETISIVESNPRKFKIEGGEIAERRAFVQRTRNFVQRMKDHLASPLTTPANHEPKNKMAMANGGSRKSYSTKYTRLNNDITTSNQHFIDDSHQQQQLIRDQQEDQLELVSTSVGVLKHMGRQIGTEIDEQNLLLDDLGHEMENTEGRLDGVLKKMAKITHMSNSKRQWIAILILVAIALIVIILFTVL